MSTILKALEQLDRNGGPPEPPPVEGFEGIDPGIQRPARHRRRRRPIWLGVGLGVAAVSLLLVVLLPGSDTPASAPPETAVAAVAPPAPDRVEVAQRAEPAPVERRVEEPPRAAVPMVPAPSAQTAARETTARAHAAAGVETTDTAPGTETARAASVVELASAAPVVETAVTDVDEEPRVSPMSREAAVVSAPESERTPPAPVEPVLHQRATAGQLPPEQIRATWPEVVPSEPAREAEAITDAPAASAPLAAPPMGLDSTSWHPSPERRSATLLVAAGEPRVVRQGDTAMGYVVVEITPSSVLFAKGDQTVRVRVGNQ